MIYVLDTDHVSALQSSGEDNRRLVARLRPVAPDDYGTTIISYEEQVRGRLAQTAVAKTPPAAVSTYGLLNDNLRFYNNIAVLQYTTEAAMLFEKLQKQKIRIGTQDLKIAVITIVNDGTLLTRNERDFSRVPDLRFADWTV